MSPNRVAAALAILPCLLFADALAGRVVFYERDVLSSWVPAIEAFVRAIAGGAWPRPPLGWDPDWAWAVGFSERFAPPIPTRWETSGSFDGDFTGLTPVALSRLASTVHAVRSEPAGLRLLRMAPVTDVVAFEDSLYGLPPRAEALSVYTLPVRIFAVPDPLPRAYFVAGVRIDGPPEWPSVVVAPAFDPRREVALDATSARSTSPPADDAGVAQIIARASDRLTIAVSARRAAVLVVTEGYDPGWRAWIDGAPAPVWRANAIFRAVPVGEGDHRVEMRYRPPSAAWGAAASVLGAVVAGVLIGRRTS